MTLSDWLWLAFAIFGPVPLVWVYKWWKVRRDIRTAEQIMDYRRRKFGGFIREPGQRGVKALDRPD